jgi:hypothetical protein
LTAHTSEQRYRLCSWQQFLTPYAQGLGERLRIPAEGVSALKVQNYLLNGSNGNFIEASSAQGVDFDSSTDRAYDSQLNDQDAQRGHR